MKTTLENFTNPIFIKDLGMQYPKKTSSQKRRYGLYQCHCGKEFKAISSADGKTKNKSCGCFAIFITKKRFDDKRKLIVESLTIKCRSCKLSLDKKYFNKSSNCASGYSGECKKCCSDRKKREYIKHRDSILNKSKQWYSKNRIKKRKYDILYRKNIPEYRKKIKSEYQRLYRKTDRGRSKMISYLHNRRSKIKNIVPFNEISNLIKKSKKCYWCGIFLKNKKVHIDHYIPLSKGGDNNLENLVVSCPSCNLRKNAKDPFEFANSIGRLL